MNPTTTHSSEVVGQFVLIEADPIRPRVKQAIGGFLAGDSCTTLEAYRGHRTLFISSEGQEDRHHLALTQIGASARPLHRRAESGSIFMNNDDTSRLDRHAPARIVRRLTKVAGIDKRISPHSLRHGFIAAALDAGVPLRDVQEAASRSDPRTTMRYDRGRGSLTGTPPTSAQPSSPAPADDHRRDRAGDHSDRWPHARLPNLPAGS